LSINHKRITEYVLHWNCFGYFCTSVHFLYFVNVVFFVFSLLWDCRLLYLFIFVKCDEWDIFLGFSSQYLYLHFFNNGPLVDISLYFVTAFCTKPWFFVLTPQNCVLNGKATHINFIVFGLTQPEMEPVYTTL
jgi:hypothetical protein